MATRYKVVRQSVRFGKQTYHVGDLLPESFSERDLYRVLYPSRIEKVEIADTEVQTPPVVPVAPAAIQTPVANAQGVTPAKANPTIAPVKPTGASLSGTTVIRK